MYSNNNITWCVTHVVLFLRLQAYSTASLHSNVFQAFRAHIISLRVIWRVPPHPVTSITTDIEKSVLHTQAASSPLIQLSVS